MNKHHIAIVGPSDSVALISRVAQEYEKWIITNPIVYRDASETAAIVKERAKEVDVWLFSGRVPYSYALTANATDRPLLYIPHTGSSLFPIFFQMSHFYKLDFSSISFDTLAVKDIQEAFEDIGLPLPQLFVDGIEGIVTADEMTNYHYQLWREGKSKAAVTGFLATYLALKAKGVPVFRIAPTRSNIRTTLDMAVKIVETNYFRESQIAIQNIAIDDFEEFVREAISSYHVKRLELQLYEILIDYAEKLKGSINIHGNGRFTIYSTRGILAEITKNFTIIPIMEEICRRLPVAVSGGIGLGQTAYDADGNSHVALSLAHRSGVGNWMVVTDERAIIGPLSSETRLEYSLHSTDRQMKGIADNLHVSVKTVNKLYAALKKINKENIRADELAVYLAITPRSARRLLGSMVEKGLAIVTGEEVAGVGRPGKLYKILVKNFK